MLPPNTSVASANVDNISVKSAMRSYSSSVIIISFNRLASFFESKSVLLEIVFNKILIHPFKYNKRFHARKLEFQRVDTSLINRRYLAVSLAF